MRFFPDPFPLHEQRERALSYLRRSELQFSPILARVVQAALDDADAVYAGLLLWACEACGGDSDAALPVAASTECFYRFSLIHDELNDPAAFDHETVASKFGLAQALNAGDAFHAVALRVAVEDAKDPKRVLEASAALMETTLRRIEWRSRFTGIERHGGEMRVRIHAAQGATRTLLLGASLRAGAILAGAPSHVSAALARAGRFLGMASAFARSADDASRNLSQRYAHKAVAAVQRCMPQSTQLSHFTEIAQQVAAGS